MPQHARTSRAFLFSLLCFCGAMPGVRAQDGDSPWLVRVWKMSEGLAGTNVSGILESSDGFLWVVAGGELMRFDGTRFGPNPVASFAGPPATKIRELARMDDGGIALALVDGSLVRIKDGQVETARGILPADQVRLEHLCPDGAGGFLASYNNESVWRVRGGKATRLTEDDGLPPGAHCRFTRDASGRLWFAKGDYVGVLRGDRFETLQRFPATLARVAAARSGGVWIGAGARLLRHLPDGTWREVARVPVTDIPVRPTFLLEDHGGAVWFGTYASGLFRFDGERLQSVPISHRQVVTMFEDREHSLWVGTSGGGLNQVQPRAITLEGGEIGVPYEAVQTIVEDRRGQLWGFTQNGLVVARHDGAWKRIDGLKTQGEVSCIAVDRDDALWIGTKAGVLHRWQDGRLATWSRAEGIATERLQNLLVSHGGDLWLGGARPATLQRLRQGRFETFELPQPATELRAITEDARGQIWVAASGRQLLRIGTDGRVVNESARIASAERGVRAMHAAEDGSLWLGFDGAGVGRLKGDTFGRVAMEHGLVNNRIELMLPDGRGWWWFAGAEALWKVSEPALVAVIEGRAAKIQPVRYGHEQGIRPVFGGTIGALRRSDGRLWIPMATSLAIIDPAQERPLAEPPPVWITEVRIDDRAVVRHAGMLPSAGVPGVGRAVLAVAPDHRRLDIDFAALSFRTPLNVAFRYRLDPFEDRWIDAGARRTASYSRLGAGDYRFRVIGCNGDGVWNEAGATLAFTVTPFFWETWWFRAVGLAVFTAGVFALARYVSFRRLRLKLRAAEQETAIERERARIARDIHDDLGSRLTKIMLLGALVKRDRAAPEKAGERIDEIADTAQQVVKSLDETVWAVDPRNDNLPEIIGYLAQFAESFLRTAEIDCELELPENPSPQHVSSPAFRHELFLAVKEALTNVVRHSHATRVRLRIAAGAGRLEVIITDNGTGLGAVRPERHADGLRNMRARMEQIGGEFRIESQPGAGTQVSLSAPWPSQ